MFDFYLVLVALRDNHSAAVTTRRPSLTNPAEPSKHLLESPKSTLLDGLFLWCHPTLQPRHNHPFLSRLDPSALVSAERNDAWIWATDVWAQRMEVRYGLSLTETDELLSLFMSRTRPEQWLEGEDYQHVAFIDSWGKIILSLRPVSQRWRNRPPAVLKVKHYSSDLSLTSTLFEHSFLDLDHPSHLYWRFDDSHLSSQVVQTFLSGFLEVPELFPYQI